MLDEELVPLASSILYAQLLNGGKKLVRVEVQVLEHGDEVDVFLDLPQRVVDGVDDNVAAVPLLHPRILAKVARGPEAYRVGPKVKEVMSPQLLRTALPAATNNLPMVKLEPRWISSRD